MRIEKIKIRKFRGFECKTVLLNEKVSVVIYNNTAGNSDPI